MSATFTMTDGTFVTIVSTDTKIGATSTETGAILPMTGAICAMTCETAITGMPGMTGGTFDMMNVTCTTTAAIFVPTGGISTTIGETLAEIGMISVTTDKAGRGQLESNTGGRWDIPAAARI